jgi:adenine-specific DNA-methyltransferase
MQDVGTGEVGTKEVESLIGKDMFDHPKPTSLIKRMLKMCTIKNNHDIILDFFAGSGTTAQAIMELNKEDGGNRKFILVQLPEKTDENSEAYKAGYLTIADICKERVRRVIKKLDNGHSETEQSEGEESPNTTLFPNDQTANHQSQTTNNQFSVFKLAPSNFKIWRSDVIENTEDLEKMMNIFDDQVKPNAEKENMLYELLLKSGYQLTVETKELVPHLRDASSKKGGYYSINNNETIILLEEINQAMVDEILKLQPKNVIALDKLFVGNDQLKTNTVLQMKDANIEFRTV